MPPRPSSVETPGPVQPWHRRAHRFATGVGVLCMLAGIAVLIGWEFGIVGLYRVLPGYVAMAPNSAVAYIASGLALTLVNRGPARGAMRAAVVALALVIGAIGLVTTAEYLTVQDLGIDRLLIPPSEFAMQPEVRPSFNAAVVWVLIAFAVAWIDRTPHRMPRPTSVLAMGTAFSAVVSLAGYLYGAAPRFGIPGYLPQTALALPSALLLLLLSIGLLAARPGVGMMPAFTSTDSGGYMARRFLLGAIALPLAGFVVSVGVRLGWFDEVFGASLIAGLGTLIAALLVVRIGGELNEADVERRKAVAELRVAEDQQRFLAELAGELSESLDLRQTLDTVARRVVPVLGDWAVVELTGAGGELQYAAIHHRDPALQPAAEALLRSVTGPAGLPAGLAEALRSEVPKLVTDLDEAGLKERVNDPGRRGRYRTLGMRSFIVMPLRARGRLLGTLNLVAAQRNFSASDFAFAREIARHAAMFTDNARLYEEAQLAIQIREDVLAVVSHDLKNPINAVRLGAGVLRKKVETEPGTNGDLRASLLRTIDTISRSTERAAKLISDLLDIARFESGSWQVTPAPERAVELLDEVGELMRAHAGAGSIRLELHAEDELLVRCERTRILQVLENLIGNAIKFQRRGGTVSVRAERGPEGQALFSVKDEGPGISQEDLPHIFDRFWQPSGSRNQGSGLGLTIARHIIDAHGGRIWAESHPGEGSTFYFTLPLTDLAPQPQRTPAAPPAGNTPHRA